MKRPDVRLIDDVQQIEDLFEDLLLPPMSPFEMDLWDAIVVASDEGRTTDMLRLVAAFEAYQVEPVPGLTNMAKVTTNKLGRQCQLTHFGMAL